MLAAHEGASFTDGYACYICCPLHQCFPTCNTRRLSSTVGTCTVSRALIANQHSSQHADNAFSIHPKHCTCTAVVWLAVRAATCLLTAIPDATTPITAIPDGLSNASQVAMMAVSLRLLLASHCHVCLLMHFLPLLPLLITSLVSLPLRLHIQKYLTNWYPEDRRWKDDPCGSEVVCI